MREITSHKIDGVKLSFWLYAENDGSAYLFKPKDGQGECIISFGSSLGKVDVTEEALLAIAEDRLENTDERTEVVNDALIHVGLALELLVKEKRKQDGIDVVR